MTINSLKAILIAILPFSFICLALQTYAGNAIEEVIVSEFRSAKITEVPSSVAVLDASLINEIATQHFEELTQHVPNLNWAGGASRPRYFQIRGIGERSQYEGAPNPSVGFVIDDLDFSSLGGIATLFDIEQVNVLRGPQGTRYGANALAGLIYVQYKKPTDIFEARVSATVGSDQTRSIGTAFGGPVSENLKYRTVIHKNKSNGFRDNAFLNRDNTNARDENSYRLKLDYALNQNWNIDFTAMHIDINNAYDAFAVDNGFTTYSDRPGKDSQRTTGSVLTIDGEISSAVSVKSISGAARSDVTFSFDADWGNNDYWSPVIYDYFSQTERNRQNLSQEIRFLSTPGHGLFNAKLDWIAGAMISNNQESNHTRDDGNFEGYLSTSSISREYEATSIAAFGDVNFSINDRTSLNSGLRFENRDAEYRDTNNDQFAPSESSVGGQVALTYRLNDYTNIYGKIARGYKAGGFNLGLPAEAGNDTLLFEAEYLWNYEIGIKGHYFDERLALNASAFWMQRRDQQVQSSSQLDPGNPASFVFFTDNAGEGTNKGLEVDANLVINEDFSLYATLGLLNTRIENFSGDSNGRQQAHAPNYTFALGGRYNFTDHWFARVDISGKDEFYFSDSHDQISEPYSLVNARFGYTQNNWSITAWGRNLFDQKYSVRGFYFGNEPARDFADTLYVRLGDPRHFGISVDYYY